MLSSFLSVSYRLAFRLYYFCTPLLADPFTVESLAAACFFGFCEPLLTSLDFFSFFGTPNVLFVSCSIFPSAMGLFPPSVEGALLGLLDVIRSSALFTETESDSSTAILGDLSWSPPAELIRGDETQLARLPAASLAR